MATQNVSNDYYIVKFIMTGNYGVGKTSILNRFTEDGCEATRTIATLGAVVKVKAIELDEKHYKLQVWDVTLSGTKAKGLRTSYYIGTTGVLVVYDVTDSRSFEDARLWLNDAKESASSEVEILLLGNKCDEDDKKRQVTVEQGRQLATEYGIQFKETSAKENINIASAFSTVFENVVTKTDFESPEYPLKWRSPTT